jgi:hypothetical protein
MKKTLDKFPCKHRFQTYLRKQNIPYKTSSDCLFIGHVSITFRHEEETIIFRDCRFSHIAFHTHYVHHLTLMAKYNRFVKMIKIASKGKAIFNLPICKN